MKGYEEKKCDLLCFFIDQGEKLMGSGSCKSKKAHGFIDLSAVSMFNGVNNWHADIQIEKVSFATPLKWWILA